MFDRTSDDRTSILFHSYIGYVTRISVRDLYEENDPFEYDRLGNVAIERGNDLGIELTVQTTSV